MSRGTVEIPVEVWEHCQQDAERMAYLHKECVRLAAENERLRKAGDAMFRYVGKSPEHSIQMDRHDKSKNDWKAAKEGGAK